jgi:hypothetical protein
MRWGEGDNEGRRLYWFISRDGGDLYMLHGLTQTDGRIEACNMFLYLFFILYCLILSVVQNLGRIEFIIFLINTGEKYRAKYIDEGNIKKPFVKNWHEWITLESRVLA